MYRIQMYIDRVLHNSLQHMFQNKEIRCSLKMQHKYLAPAQTWSFERWGGGGGCSDAKLFLDLSPSVLGLK